jgi:uncharacterized protein (TIGR00290 family)
MKVAISWSGEKESCLAYHRAVTQGHKVAFLITVVLNDWPSLCHPLSIMSLQSQALGIRHLTFKVREPHMEGYREIVAKLAREEGIEGLVTGDIWIDDHRRWMEDVCKGLPVAPIMPLWGISGEELLGEVVSKGLKPVFTCVKEPWFDDSWLGSQLDAATIRSLKEMAARHGIDICGERGEYHTMVLDGPGFKRPIEISESTKGRKGSVLILNVKRSNLANEQTRP